MAAKRKRYSGSIKPDVFDKIVLITGPWGSVSKTIEVLCEEAIAARNFADIKKQKNQS